MNSTTFYVDCLCLLPLDFLYLSLGYKSILRIFRLVKVYQFWAFMDRTERHTNYPNLFRFFSLIHYLLVAFHWNACVFHLLHYDKGFGGAVCEGNEAITSSMLSSIKSSSSCNSASMAASFEEGGPCGCLLGFSGRVLFVASNMIADGSELLVSPPFAVIAYIPKAL